MSPTSPSPIPTFVDGNGRVARLIMNLILLQEGYHIALIPPVLRTAYITSLEAAHKNDETFLTLICRCVYETQRDYLRMIEGLESSPRPGAKSDIEGSLRSGNRSYLKYFRPDQTGRSISRKCRVRPWFLRIR